MENKFNNLISEMKNSKMTAEEKSAMHFKIMTFAENNPIQIGKSSPYRTQPSPYFSTFSFFTSFGKVALASFLLVIIGVGGLSSASADALPGDILYPIKINVREKIEEKLTLNIEDKIALSQIRIDTRFNEAENLIKENKLTEKNRSIVDKKIEEEKQKISENLSLVTGTSRAQIENEKIKIEASIAIRQEKIENQIVESELMFIENDLEKESIQYINDIKIEEKINNIILEEERYRKIENELENKNQEESIIQDIKITPETMLIDTPISSEKINSTTRYNQ